MPQLLLIVASSESSLRNLPKTGQGKGIEQKPQGVLELAQRTFPEDLFSSLFLLNGFRVFTLGGGCTLLMEHLRTHQRALSSAERWQWKVEGAKRPPQLPTPALVPVPSFRSLRKTGESEKGS